MVSAIKVDYHDILSEYTKSLQVFEKQLSDATKLLYTSAKKQDRKGMQKVLDMANEAALEGSKWQFESTAWLRIEKREESPEDYAYVEDEVNDIMEQLKSILQDFKSLTKEATYYMKIMKL